MLQELVTMLERLVDSFGTSWMGFRCSWSRVEANQLVTCGSKK